jgi:hypothetical protein
MCLERLCEKCHGMHKSSINLVLHLVAAIVVIWALWKNNIIWILVGLLIAIIGHIIEEAKKKMASKTRTTTKKAGPIRKRKKGALEMSIGTIVILVIAVTMLILGIVFVRSIMCSGIQMSDQLSKGVKGKITDLFGADKFGVKCMGEDGEPIILGSGGTRPIVCVIKVEDESEYNITVKDIKSLDGASKETVEEWIIDKNWEGIANPGDDKQANVIMMDVPRDAPTTKLKISLESINLDTDKKSTHIAYVNIQPAGFFRTTMC